MNKKKSISIDLVEKKFNSKLKGEYSEPISSELIFTKLYINKHYKKILHYLPYIELSLDSIEKESDTDFSHEIFIIDYNKNYLYNKKKDKKEFVQYTKLFKNTNKRFTYFPVMQNTFYLDGVRDIHSIFFIYDKLINQVELFDSNAEDFYFYKTIFNKFFRNIYGKKIKIIYPESHCPFFSELQVINCPDINYIYNSTGYCSVWSLWYLELRLKNKDLSRDQVISKSLTLFKKGDQRICKLIRGYAQFIQEITNKFDLKIENEKIFIIIKESKKKSVKYMIPKTLIAILGLTGTLIYLIKKLNLL